MLSTTARREPASPARRLHRRRCRMTPDRIARVRASWTLLAPIAETAAARFYERLFELDPSLVPLFAAADPATQRRKLVQTLAMVVAGIEDFDRLLPAVEAL